MLALFSILRLRLSETQYSSDTTSKISAIFSKLPLQNSKSIEKKSALLENIKNMEGVPLEDIKMFSEKNLGKGAMSHSVEKVEEGTLLLWNGFGFHVGGPGWVQNRKIKYEMLSAKVHKMWTIQSQTDEEN